MNKNSWQAKAALAGAETLHMAHVLLQLDKGYFCGDKAQSGRGDRTWNNHLLGPLTPNGPQHRRGSRHAAGVSRWEAQARHPALPRPRNHTQPFSDFLENVEAIGLETKMRATIPPKDTEPLLHGIVMDSQGDYKDSKLPVREEPSVWDADAQKVLLQHDADAKDHHIRAYFKGLYGCYQVP